MKVLEGLEEDGKEGEAEKEGKPASKNDRTKKLKDVNVLCRPLLKQQLEKERDRKMRYDLNNSLSTRNEASDSEDDQEAKFDKRADELDDEDEELAEYETLSFVDRLEKVVKGLRDEHRYCFWCKYQYPDVEMDGCPGLSEDEHG